MEDMKKIIEIGGVKLEVDMRTAKKIEAFKVGDPCKLLHKGRYSSDKWRVSHGIIAGFGGFEKLPTIVVAYLDLEYGDGELKFAHLNAQTEEYELATAADTDLSIEKSNVLDIMDRKITVKQNELRELQVRKDYFLKNFGKYFEQADANA